MTNGARRYCHDKSQTRLPFGARARDTIQVFTWLQPSSSAFLCLEEKPVSLSSARNNNFNSLSCDVRYCRLGEESKLFAFVGVCIVPMHPIAQRVSCFERTTRSANEKEFPIPLRYAFVSAYLRRGYYNVILVDWAKLTVLPWYITAVRNARIIGPYLARMMSWLDAQQAVPLAKIHVIGFSLGAEVAGFMGKALAPRKVRMTNSSRFAISGDSD